MSGTADPLLSVVVTSRNDDHGGDARRRMRIFFAGLLEQARRHRLAAELIVVEWNPPADRPRLAEVMPWPAGGHIPVRFIEVPAEVHRRFRHSDRLPLFQMIAKNVGIRRARGRFVLATNIDILFSDALVAGLAAGGLRAGRMYRLDRTDVSGDVPDDVPVERQLEFCRRNVIRINARQGTFAPNEPRRCTCLPQSAGAAISAVTGGVRRVRQFVREWLSLRDQTVLHTNACGDFTLMARRDWDSVRAYAEFQMFSFKLDSLLCHAAHYAGVRETVLRDPMRIYHIEHAPGSGWTPGAGAALLNKRLAESGVPQLDGRLYSSWVRRMRLTRRPVMVNPDDRWGLADETLPERVFGG